MRDHVTHHDDCGCQSAALQARITTLEAELAGMRAQWEQWTALGKIAEQEGREIIGECHQWQARASALRDALEKASKNVRPPHDVWGATCRTCAMPWESHRPECPVGIALAQTPAASLAAHDAEVLERVAKHFAQMAAERPGQIGQAFYEAADREVRALAAQEVKP